MEMLRKIKILNALISSVGKWQPPAPPRQHFSTHDAVDNIMCVHVSSKTITTIFNTTFF